MKEAWDSARAINVLGREIELLRLISGLQNNARKAAMTREWAGFDEKSLDMNRFSAEFALLEEEREALFSSLKEDLNCSDEEITFSFLIAGLPDNERKDLSALYRELKLETNKMRVLNETFLAYLNEAKNLASAYIGAVCPDRGGKLYTRKGSTVSPDLRSIVVNSRF